MAWNTASGRAALFRENGDPIALGRHIGGGGEGWIFTVNGDPGRAAKVYKRPAPEQGHKLRSMLKAAPQITAAGSGSHVSFCWPEELLFDAAGGCAGFLMPRLDSAYHRIGIYWNAEDRAAVAAGFTWKYLFVTAANTASLLESLHGKGHVVGDLNDENLLADDRALVALVDCDSIQIKDPETSFIYRCGVGREAYTSPERIGTPFGSFDRATHDDDWAFAVLIFTMLMEGHHPTDGIGYPLGRRERVQKGIFAFLGAADVLPPKYALRFDTLPESLRALFLRCFLAGHADPAARPTAAEWKRELTQTASGLAQCDRFELHWFPSGASDCPWCEQRELWGVERFAADPAGVNIGTGADQVELPRATGGLPGSAPMSAASPRSRLRSGILAAAACVLALAVGGTSILLEKPPAANKEHIVPVPKPQKAPVAPIREETRPVAPVVVAENRRASSRLPARDLASASKSIARSIPIGPPKSAPPLAPPTASLVLPAPPMPPGAAAPLYDARIPETLVKIPRAPNTDLSPDVRLNLDELRGVLQAQSPVVSRGAPKSGILLWSGEVAKGVPVAIEGRTSGLGAVNGDPLPGVQVVIDRVTPEGVIVIEPPSSATGYQRLVFRSSFSRKQVITFAWRTP